MPDRDDSIERGDDDVERRIARARAAIRRSLDELSARGEPSRRAEGWTAPPPGGQAPEPPAAAPRPAAASPDTEQIAALVERRISDWVGQRIHAAERRLELQSAALEAEIGESVARHLDAAGRSAPARSDAELTAALRRATDELRLRLDADRDGLRRELSDAASAEVARAAGQVEALRADALREAREMADAIAASRLADARAELSAEVQRAGEENRREIERRITDLEGRLGGLVDAAAAERVAVAVDATEERLIARLSARLSEMQRLFDERMREFREEAAGQAPGGSGAAAEEAAARAHDAARAGISAEVEAAVARAVGDIREDVRSFAEAAAKSALAAEASEVGAELQRAMAASAGEQMQAVREETSRQSYRSFRRQAEDAIAAQLARSLDVLKSAHAGLVEESAAAVRAEGDARSAELRGAAEAGAAELASQVAALRAELGAEARADAVEAVASELARHEESTAVRLRKLLAEEEERMAVRLTAAVADAERRLADVADAQAREERIRERTAEAERQAAERVREAERRLVEVLAAVSTVEQRVG